MTRGPFASGERAAHEAVEQIFRVEYGRVVASLVRRFGAIDLAEEAAGEALLVAVERWPRAGVPPNHGGWLTTTAGNWAIDRISRSACRRPRTWPSGSERCWRSSTRSTTRATCPPPAPRRCARS